MTAFFYGSEKCLTVYRNFMRGAIPPLPSTPSWCGAQFKKHRDNFTLYLCRSQAVQLYSD